MLYSIQSISQELYSDRLNHYIDSLDVIYGENLEDSIWNHLLEDFPERMIGSKVSGITFHTLKDVTINIDSIDGPIFLQATASWCRPCVEEIPALNQIVADYSENFTFILLTHDTFPRAKTMSEKLESSIHVVPSSNHKDIDKIEKLNVSGFSHILPFPTTYYVDDKKRIYAIEHGGPIAGDFTAMDGTQISYTKDSVYVMNYRRISKRILEGIK